MRKPMLAGEWTASPYLTTGDVARLLERTPRGTRWLVDAHGIRCERTENGHRLFRPAEIDRLLARRQAARLRGVRMLRPHRLNVSGEPRQLSLFGPRRVENPAGRGSTFDAIGAKSV